MNQKDREGIGYMLSESGSFQEFREMLFERFPKIKEEYDLFQECQGISEDMQMTEEEFEAYSKAWCCPRRYSDDRRADPELGQRLLDQARINIQGE